MVTFKMVFIDILSCRGYQDTFVEIKSLLNLLFFSDIGLDVNYVNLDSNPYPSLVIRSSESRSTGTSEVFSSGWSFFKCLVYNQFKLYDLNN